MLALHLTLVLSWPSEGPRQSDQGAQQRHFTLTFVPALRPRAPPLPPPVRVPQAATRVTRARAPTAPRPAPASNVKTVPGAAEMPQPSAATAASTPDTVDVNKMMDSAKRQAGSIDRELRGGKPAPLAPDSELPMARFRSALESAFIDRSTAIAMDMQTQSDGVIIYRYRRGGKVWCRQSGGGGPSAIAYSDGAKLAGAGSRGGAGTAGSVACPSGGSGWSRL